MSVRGKKAPADLRTALKGEFYGEAVFQMAWHAFARQPGQRQKSEEIRKLETQTKERLLRYFRDNGIAVPGKHFDMIHGGLQGLFFPVLPWRLLMKMALRKIDHHLPVLHRLEQQAAVQDKALFRYLLEHELAIRHFVEMELAGQSSASLEQVTGLLAAT